MNLQPFPQPIGKLHVLHNGQYTKHVRNVQIPNHKTFKHLPLTLSNPLTTQFFIHI